MDPLGSIRKNREISMAAKCQFGVRASNYFSSDNAESRPRLPILRSSTTEVAPSVRRACSSCPKSINWSYDRTVCRAHFRLTSAQHLGPSWWHRVRSAPAAASRGKRFSALARCRRSAAAGFRSAFRPLSVMFPPNNRDLLPANS